MFKNTWKEVLNWVVYLGAAQVSVRMKMVEAEDMMAVVQMTEMVEVAVVQVAVLEPVVLPEAGAQEADLEVAKTGL
jgi:hypothetical protein